MKVQYINDWQPELRSLLHTLKSHGFTVESACNGEETVGGDAGTDAIVANLEACDESWLKVRKDGLKATFYIVLGNSPGELIADCTYNRALETATDEIISQHYDRWTPRKQPVKRGYYGPGPDGKFGFQLSNLPVGTEVQS